MLGYFFCTEACTYGKAGPAQALMEMQSVWQLVLEMIVYGNIPTYLQGVGMAIALSGSVVVAVELPCLAAKDNKLDDEFAAVE